MANIPFNIQAKIESARVEKLKELDLSYSATSFKLREIPPQIFELKDLEVLNLRNNEISVIPRGILNLRNLKALNLIDNKITEIPEYLSELRDLKSLNISYFDDSSSKFKGGLKA